MADSSLVPGQRLTHALVVEVGSGGWLGARPVPHFLVRHQEHQAEHHSPRLRLFGVLLTQR